MQFVIVYVIINRNTLKTLMLSVYLLQFISLVATIYFHIVLRFINNSNIVHYVVVYIIIPFYLKYIKLYLDGMYLM